jgi:hypothetical protein
MRSPPVAFATALSIPSFPFTFLRRPRHTSGYGELYTPRQPLVLTGRPDVAGEKNTYSPTNGFLFARRLGNDADGVPAFPDRRRLSTPLPSFKPRDRILHTLRLDGGRQRVSTSTSCLTTTLSFYRYPPRLVLLGEAFGPAQTTRPMEKVPHTQSLARSRTVQQFAEAGQKWLRTWLA